MLTILYLILGIIIVFFVIQFALAALVVIIPVGIILYIIYYFKHHGDYNEQPYEANYTETPETNEYTAIDVIDASYTEKEENINE